MQKCKRLGGVFFVILLVGCATEMRAVSPKNRVLETKNEKQAQLFLAQEKYQQAAVLFQYLAAKPSPQQDVFRLQAAQTWLKIDENNKAELYLNLISSKQLNLRQVNQLHLLYMQLYLNSNRTKDAISEIEEISRRSLNNVQQRNFYKLSAFAYALEDKFLASAQQRIKLEAYLNTEDKNVNNKAILDMLSLVPLDILDRQVKKGVSEIALGWLDMGILRAKFTQGTSAFNQAVEQWKKNYVDHPGQLFIDAERNLPVDIVLGDVSKIAVFLPMSGGYKIYAKAIKAGVMAAYRRHKRDGVQPEIQFYNTRDMDISSLYEQAIQEGAELVIGPLDKKLITQLVESTHLRVPVLALNYVDGLIKENLYQFALSPIDEVKQVVQHARAEGYHNAIILAPESSEGARISTYFKNDWEALGGRLLNVQTYKMGEKDFSFPVKQLLNINESQGRAKKIRKTIGGIEYNLRRRRDVDVIFIVASQSVARLINPQFYHNRAKSVAVYGLSRVFLGRVDRKKDIDLEGVRFCTIPWLFDGAYEGDLKKQLVQGVVSEYPAKYSSLIAFGIDAYTLLPYLDDLGSLPYDGATGKLLLNKYHRVERGLVCAEYKKGKVVLLDQKQAGTIKKAAIIKKPVLAW